MGKVWIASSFKPDWHHGFAHLLFIPDALSEIWDGWMCSQIIAGDGAATADNTCNDLQGLFVDRKSAMKDWFVGLAISNPLSISILMAFVLATAFLFFRYSISCVRWRKMQILRGGLDWVSFGEPPLHNFSCILMEKSQLESKKVVACTCCQMSWWGLHVFHGKGFGLRPRMCAFWLSSKDAESYFFIVQ